MAQGRALFAVRLASADEKPRPCTDEDMAFMTAYLDAVTRQEEGKERRCRDGKVGALAGAALPGGARRRACKTSRARQNKWLQVWVPKRVQGPLGVPTTAAGKKNVEGLGEVQDCENLIAAAYGVDACVEAAKVPTFKWNVHATEFVPSWLLKKDDAVQADTTAEPIQAPVSMPEPYVPIPQLLPARDDQTAVEVTADQLQCEVQRSAAAAPCAALARLKSHCLDGLLAEDDGDEVHPVLPKTTHATSSRGILRLGSHQLEECNLLDDDNDDDVCNDDQDKRSKAQACKTSIIVRCPSHPLDDADLLLCEDQQQ